MKSAIFSSDNWVSNVYDPNKRDAKNHLVSANAPPEKRDMLFKYAKNHYLTNYLIGDPQPTETMSVEDLKKNGYVGLYRKNLNLDKILGDHGRFANDISAPIKFGEEDEVKEEIKATVTNVNTEE